MNEEKGKNSNTVLLTIIGIATLLIAVVGATFAYFSANVINQSNESLLITSAVVGGLEYSGSSNIDLTGAMPGVSETSSFTISNPSTITKDGKSYNNSSILSYDLQMVIEENTLTTAAEAGVSDPTNQLLDQLQLWVGIGTFNAGTVNGATSSAITKIGFAASVTPNSLSFNSYGSTSPETENGKYTGYYNVTNGATYGANTKYNLVTNQILGVGGSVQYNIKLYFVDTSVPQNNNQGKAFRAHFEVVNVRSVNASSLA